MQLQLQGKVCENEEQQRVTEKSVGNRKGRIGSGKRLE
jgi:hypothetical protein